MNGWFTTRNLHHIWFSFIFYNGIKHSVDFFQSSVSAVIWGRIGVTSWAGKITSICNFYNRKARMLLVIGAQTTIVRTTKMYFGVEFQWHFRLFIVVSDLFVIFYIIGNHYFGFSVSFTIFEHPNFVISKNNFSINSFQTFWAKTFGIIVVNVISLFVHLY